MLEAISWTVTISADEMILKRNELRRSVRIVNIYLPFAMLLCIALFSYTVVNPSNQ
jgi:hypothetical protein